MKRLIVIALIMSSLTGYTQKKDRMEVNRIISLCYVANIPKAPVGISFILHLGKSGFGIYMDVKSGMADKKKGKDYTGIITREEAEEIFGDPFQGEKDQGPLIVNLGITYAINKAKNLLIYAGGGYSAVKVYRQYYDPSHILSEDGYYYFKDVSKSKSNANFTGGLIYIRNVLTLQVGLDAIPFGVVVGIGFTL